MTIYASLPETAIRSPLESDLDGMFGKEQSPYDLETIADLQNLQGLLLKRGYSNEGHRKYFLGKLVTLSSKCMARIAAEPENS